MRIDEKYKYKTSPKSRDAAIVRGDKYRFTVLTPRLIRMEYNENGYFEDKATQVVINRDFDVPEFSVKDEGEILTIRTEFVELIYNKKPFSKYSLTVNTYASGAMINIWKYDEENATNLKGTCRTLDRVEGACPLENGIMSRNATPVLFDDSDSLVIDEDGWASPREEKYTDQYLFCYGYMPDNYDYKLALREFYMLTGATPLLPRFSLGNWWSRYHAYTQEEYTSLMARFKAEDVPFAVSVIDIDWHYIKIDPKYGSGWTGYTWNTELIPDYKALLSHLHSEGMEVTLNVHPAEGVAAHESMYPEMAKAMGKDPSTEEKVLFEIENPKFLENYFNILHHPYEEDGVTFWWVDWQQGSVTSVPGLDPLWMLNHFHTLDNARDGKRPLILSRYAGPGSHRYPVGFSGDTVSTWPSLEFQPYFTATSSNIGYGWWSHDIGGHMLGKRDCELVSRWIQLGVFSPINRLHSSPSPFFGKEPWNFDKISEITMKKFLRLRHELIPYIYSMNYRAHTLGEPIVMPLYYTWDNPTSYEHKNEFTFGTEFIVSPITKPHDKDTMCGSAATYLPEGVWYDFFTNRRYDGGKTFTAYREMYDMPVFVKAGGIVPMAKLMHVNDVENPENMKIKVFAGADNVFDLYEDDGVSYDYENGKCAHTKLELSWGVKPTFTVNKPEGDATATVAKRNYEIEFIGVSEASSVTVSEGGMEKAYTTALKNGVFTVCVENVSDTLTVSFTEPVELKRNSVIEDICKLLHIAEIEFATKDALYEKLIGCENKTEMLREVCNADVGDDVKRALCEVITAED